MTIRTILLHITNDVRCAARTRSAIALATRHKAHLVGIYSIVPLVLPGYAGIALPTQVYDDFANKGQEDAAAAQKAFEEATRRDGISAEWRLERGVPLETLKAHTYYADVAIVGQAPAKDEAPLGGATIAGDLAIASGRPVLAIPGAGDYPKIGESVTIAWNDSREAARAVADAMPFLKAAKRVQVLAANPPNRAPALDLATHLARHGLTVETKTVHVDDISVGDAILNAASDAGSDLLVMGAYGHGRFNEFVFGGATRHILRHMTLPVLISH